MCPVRCPAGRTDRVVGVQNLPTRRHRLEPSTSGAGRGHAPHAGSITGQNLFETESRRPGTGLSRQCDWPGLLADRGVRDVREVLLPQEQRDRGFQGLADTRRDPGRAGVPDPGAARGTRSEASLAARYKTWRRSSPSASPGSARGMVEVNFPAGMLQNRTTPSGPAGDEGVIGEELHTEDALGAGREDSPERNVLVEIGVARGHRVHVHVCRPSRRARAARARRG